jgi:hypothetical protein
MCITQSGRASLDRSGSPREPAVWTAPFAPEMSAIETLAPSRTGTSMATIAPYLGKGPKLAQARRHHPIAGIVTAAILCGSVLLSVPPMVSTLHGLP